MVRSTSKQVEDRRPYCCVVGEFHHLRVSQTSTALFQKNWNPRCPWSRLGVPWRITVFGHHQRWWRFPIPTGRYTGILQ